MYYRVEPGSIGIWLYLPSVAAIASRWVAPPPRAVSPPPLAAAMDWVPALACLT